MNRLALALGVAVALSISSSSAQKLTSPDFPPPAPKMPSEWFDRMRAWMKAVRTHQQGLADEPALSIGAWASFDVSVTIVNVAKLVTVIKAANDRDAKTGVLRSFEYYGRLYTRAQLLKLFQLEPTDPLVADPHEILLSGTLLHSDVAMLPPSGRPVRQVFSTGASSVRSVLTSDGVVDRTDDASEHWIHARRLLNFVMLAPSDQDREWGRHWYRSTAAWQSAARRWSVAGFHLSRSRDVFPDDGRLLFYAGTTHEVLGGPVIQAATERVARLGAWMNVGGSSKELEQAAFWLRESTRLDPDFALGHLHLGRVLGGLGRHEEALRELTMAAAGLIDREQTYYVNLFLGYERGVLGDRDTAAADFERAAAAYPWAQSPLVGLSQLARYFDDPAATHAALDRLLALPVDDGRFDPWWDYMCSHVRDANQLMDGVRQSLAARSGR
jgi:tetratricopeptide (TPR) repeat protein